MRSKITGSKRSLSWLIILMTISLLGVTGIQAYWLNNAYRLEQEKFEQQVARVLDGVADRIEALEALNLLNENIELEPYLKSNQGALMGVEGGLRDSSMKIRSAEGTYSVAIRLGEDSINVYENQTENLPGLFYSSKDTNYRIAFAERQKLEGKFKTMDKVFDQLLLRTLDKNSGKVKNRLTEKQLDSLLDFELGLAGVDLDYEYKVVEDGEAVYRSEGWPRDSSANEAYEASLFPNDFFNRASLLVIFEGETSYILRNLWITLVISFLFTAAMIYTFGRTLSFSIRQKRISEIKTDFINNMTHEFKTPIATINLAIDALRNPKVLSDEKRVHHYSELIRQENNRMNMQVEGVLRMALMDKRELDFNFEKLAAQEIVNESLKQLTLQIESHQTEVQTDFRDGGAEVMVDRTHFANVVLNLLDNALKYSSGKPRIELVSEKSQNHYILMISDNGIGMSREEQKHIFDRFYRVASGNIHTIKGHGLGLSYARGVIEAHGGRIEVQSEKGKGSTFYIYLPLADLKNQ